MANPETPAEPTAPAEPKPAPPPAPDPKPQKKIDPMVLAAVIGALVTITTAVLSSPVLLALISKLGAPAPTATAWVISTEIFGSEIFVDSPTPSPATTSTASALPPTAESAATATAAPTSSAFTCIAADTWTPFPANLNPTASAGCWELADWGFSTRDGQLLIATVPTLNQQRGIYLPIAGDMDIHFTLQIDQFRVRSFDTAFLNFGIIQREPLSIFSGGFLSYSQNQPGAADIQVFVSGSNQATQRLPALAFGAPQAVTLSVRGALLTIYLDGELTGEPVALTANERALWIGYVLPAKGTLETLISDFSVQPQ